MKQWHCSVGNQRYGPVSEVDLKAWIAQGRVRPTDLVWTDGMSQWAPMNSVPELQAAAPAGGPGGGPPPLGGPPIGGAQTYLPPHRGGMILAFGILGLLVCVIFGIIAWVMGNNDLRKMDAGQMDPAGRDSTNAGKICGMIGTILALVGFAIAIFWILFAAGSVAAIGLG